MNTKTKIFLCIILSVIILLYSCEKEITNTTIVNGQIIDSLTNEPIELVSVTLQQEDLFVYPAFLRDTLTDSNGRFYFKFEWQNYHAYSVSVWKTGYKQCDDVFLKRGVDQKIVIKLIKDSN